MIYIHIPFCESFCTYCDFYSEIAATCKSSLSVDKFAKALEFEAEFLAKRYGGTFINNDSPDSIYLGGGTPSVLPLNVFERVLQAAYKLRQAIRHAQSLSTNMDSFLQRDVSQGALSRGVEFEKISEFTVEVNPEDVVSKGKDYFKALFNMGVNRISMGVQSFDDSLLKWMNRRHNASEAIKAYDILRSCGFENVSIDLISGISGLDVPTWKRTVETAISLHPEHISSYQLSIEPGSALAKLVAKGRYKEATQEQCEEQYYMLCNMLASAGYGHYEISNFALPGFEAIHNGAYWKRVPYLGLGPGAHSLLPAVGKLRNRIWNPQSLTAYINAAEEYASQCDEKDSIHFEGAFEDYKEGEILSDDEIVTETIMLGLRTRDGVSQEYLEQNASPKDFTRLRSLGMLSEPDKFGNIHIPEKYIFLSDSIISDLI